MADADYTNEKWLPVVSYPDYEVSDHGRVRSVDRTKCYPVNGWRTFKSRVLKQHQTRAGHMQVRISNDDGVKTFLAHRLVLEAFVGPCPEGMEACHWDDNPANNLLSNLRWDTRSNNHYDRVRNGIHPQANKTHCKWGHEYTPENTQIVTAGHRRCRTCERASQARIKARKRAARNSEAA